MSTFCMARFYPREGAPSPADVGMWEAQVPGLGNVMVALTDKGVALIMPDADPVRSEMQELRNEMRELIMRLKRQDERGARKAERKKKNAPAPTDTQPFRTGMSKAEYDAAVERAQKGGA